MTQIEEQSFTFFVVGIGPASECILHVDADSTLESIREEMVDAGITCAGYGTVLAKLPNGDLAQACLRHDGTIKWDMLTSAIREAQKGTNMGALTCWLENTSDITLSPFFDEYIGLFSSAADHAEGAAIASGELAQVPERLRNYIDWASVARDAEQAGGIWTRETVDGCHIFRS